MQMQPTTYLNETQLAEQIKKLVEKDSANLTPEEQLACVRKIFSLDRIPEGNSKIPNTVNVIQPNGLGAPVDSDPNNNDSIKKTNHVSLKRLHERYKSEIYPEIRAFNRNFVLLMTGISLPFTPIIPPVPFLAFTYSSFLYFLNRNRGDECVKVFNVKLAHYYAENPEKSENEIYEYVRKSLKLMAFNEETGIYYNEMLSVLARCPTIKSEKLDTHVAWAINSHRATIDATPDVDMGSSY